ncbi:4Fe-4S binding protein [Streptosporangium saharense]|uniref:4Fe-4S binding protein n=1 Tax=Streptosporangium saharense TaxID=1706840 RepID=UPI003681D644
MIPPGTGLEPVCPYRFVRGALVRGGRGCQDVEVARIPGVGLAKGLSVTLRHMLSKSVTQQYPEVRPDLPARSRGVIGLVEENCTVCMLCARECPDWCIYIDSHKETLPAPEGGRPRARNMLDRFAIDFSLCMYCGICIEVCPFDALFWSPEFEYAEGDIRNLLHEKDKLAGWARTVPPPPAHDPNADPPKELAAGTRPARTPSGPGASRGGPSRGAASEKPGSPAGPSQEAPDFSMRSRSIRPPGAPPTDVEGPSSGSESERPARRASAGHMNVRAIRPPGALPKKDVPPPGEADSSTSDAPESSAEGGGSRPGRTDGGAIRSPGARDVPPPGEAESGVDRPVRRASTGHSDVRAIRPPGALPKEDTPSSEEPGRKLSTGESADEKLSTGGGGASPAEGATEQTFATEPNGGLQKPREPQEPEES